MNNISNNFLSSTKAKVWVFLFLISLTCLLSSLGAPNFSLFQNTETLIKPKSKLTKIVLPSLEIAGALNLSICKDEFIDLASEKPGEAKKIFSGLSIFQTKLQKAYLKDSFEKLVAKILNFTPPVATKACLPRLEIGGKKVKLESGVKILLDDQILTCGSTPQVNPNHQITGYSISDSINSYLGYLSENKVIKKTESELRELEAKRQKLRANNNTSGLKALNQEILKVQLAREYALFFTNYGQVLDTAYLSVCTEVQNQQAPRVPSGVNFSNSSKELSYSGDADAYIVYLSSDNGASFKELARTTNHKVILTNLSNNFDYFVKVVALKKFHNVSLVSDYSLALKVRIPATLPVIEPTPVSTVNPNPNPSAKPTSTPIPSITPTPQATGTPIPTISPTPTILPDLTISNSWQNRNFTNQSGSFRVTFKAKPLNNNMDSVTGLSNGTANWYDSLATTVRFASNGKIDAINGGAYTAEQNVSYVAGKEYFVTMDVHLTTKKYSITVANDQGQTFSIANNYNFRILPSGAGSNVTQLNNLSSYAYIGSHQLLSFSNPQSINPPATTPTPPAPSPTPTELRSSGVWQSKAIALQTGSFRITYKTIPQGNNIDSLTGLSNGIANGYDSLATTLRFASNGKVDARNGTVYSAVQAMNYVSGKEYLVTMDVHLLYKKYSVTVQNDSGEVFQIATNYPFRETQLGTSQLNFFSLYAVTGSQIVSNITNPITINTPGTNPTPYPTPVATPTPVPTSPPPISCIGESTKSCSIPNGTGVLTRSCINGNWSNWGTHCIVKECNNGFENAGDSSCIV